MTNKKNKHQHMKSIIKVVILLFSISIFSQVEKIEPPFWWSNMKNPELQLVVYGNNIAKYDVSISDNIKIINVRKTENPNYQFITVSTENINPGNINITFSEKGKKIQTLAYEFKQRRENSSIRDGFDSSDAMYLIMPDRFANGNPNNDSTADTVEKADRTNPGGRHGGDIQGVIDHLDYINDLGFT